MALVDGTIYEDLRGLMVWYCSVEGGLKYEPSWDCSGSEESMKAYIEAMKQLKDASTADVVSAEDRDEDTREGKKKKKKKNKSKKANKGKGKGKKPKKFNNDPKQ